MPWTPSYAATYTKALIRQLVALVQRDQRAALDYVGGTDNPLPSIVNYQVAFSPLNQFPALLIAPLDSTFTWEAVGTRQSANRIFVAIACAHQDTQALGELVQDYVRALDLLLMSLPLSDFYTSLPINLPMLAGQLVTTPLLAGTVKELFVLGHGYDDIRRARTGFTQAATLEVRIDREEA